ncbi:MAG: hypothetical protein E6R04_10990 [Spirochaetes bacterium]|nr:MAG: hypothetical protein E6R04_10990 [Spirochaetota bacterium]
MEPDLENAARAVGAALGQRKLVANDQMDALERWREPALFHEGDGPGDVQERLDKFIASVVLPANPAAPESALPSTMGANLITNGGTELGSKWRAGPGAEALTKMVFNEMERSTAGFGYSGRAIRRLLDVLAHATTRD